MSRASKVFLASSIALSGVTVWGVHYIQKLESDNMYQGVLKDEARLAEKAAALLKAAASPLSSSSPSSNPNTQAHSSNTPLNTPSSPVQQPAPTVDPECQTCVISPPPQLLESQSAEQRAKERQLRMKEYEDQKKLDVRLRDAQGVSREPTGSSRLV
ncbi:hypothetical protein I317_07058 [Kwoniella heveanensis CBS 569]|uniref:Uncharacterized protein n=1 Tax=Kwoniella heveanensis BCC8398 TaxID=1296120 RepID=A0A1B9GWC3_9TREE|nr:hypothetical protein I316_02879 [Kwoniella heveanensis BCC8398]OCF39159.1 hypothetical protein I317_07058 [Kwoniella heveanensis CBS 569]